MDRAAHVWVLMAESLIHWGNDFACVIECDISTCTVHHLNIPSSICQLAASESIMVQSNIPREDRNEGQNRGIGLPIADTTCCCLLRCSAEDAGCDCRKGNVGELTWTTPGSRIVHHSQLSRICTQHYRLVVCLGVDTAQPECSTANLRHLYGAVYTLYCARLVIWMFE